MQSIISAPHGLSAFVERPKSATQDIQMLGLNRPQAIKWRLAPERKTSVTSASE